MAGASVVEVGTATFWDPTAPVRIARELEALLPKLGVTHVGELIGNWTALVSGGTCFSLYWLLDWHPRCSVETSPSKNRQNALPVLINTIQIGLECTLEVLSP